MRTIPSEALPATTGENVTFIRASLEGGPYQRI